MRINKLSIRNFRCFEFSQFEFHSTLNIIIGANASGKSSLLAALRAATNSFAMALSPQYHDSGILSEDVRYLSVIAGRQVRFEKRYPVEVSASGTVSDKAYEWLCTRTGGHENSPSDVEVKAFSIAAELKKNIGLEVHTAIPLVVFYGAGRNKQPAATSFEESVGLQVSRLDAYDSWFDAFMDRRTLEEWVIGKTLERLQKLDDGLLDPSSSNEEELNIVNAAVSKCLPKAKGLRYDLRMRSLLVEFEADSMSFQSLSDGQQGMIILIADIARRLCILNPHFGAEVLSLSTGILVIDELDIHLHPAWQRLIIDVLRTTFPLMQIFATSHSPQMIGELRPEEVLILDNGKALHPGVTYGLDSNRILEEVMNTGARDGGINSMLNEVARSIEENDFDAANQKMTVLRQAAPELPEYSRLEILIRRKQVIGR